MQTHSSFAWSSCVVIGLLAGCYQEPDSFSLRDAFGIEFDTTELVADGESTSTIRISYDEGLDREKDLTVRVSSGVINPVGSDEAARQLLTVRPVTSELLEIPYRASRKPESVFIELEFDGLRFNYESAPLAASSADSLDLLVSPVRVAADGQAQFGAVVVLRTDDNTQVSEGTRVYLRACCNASGPEGDVPAMCPGSDPPVVNSAPFRIESVLEFGSAQRMETMATVERRVGLGAAPEDQLVWLLASTSSPVDCMASHSPLTVAEPIFLQLMPDE